MTRRLSVRPLAERDVTHLVQWYDRQSRGRGDDFLASLERTLQQILDPPELYPVFVAPVWRAPLHRFPYGVVYRVSDRTIDVLGVMPAKGGPACRAQRLTTLD